MDPFPFRDRLALGPASKNAGDTDDLRMNALGELGLPFHFARCRLNPDRISILDPFALGRFGIDEDLVRIRVVLSEITQPRVLRGKGKAMKRKLEIDHKEVIWRRRIIISSTGFPFWQNLII